MPDKVQLQYKRNKRQLLDARGYLVRFGVSPEKMHLSRQVKECRVDVRSLSIDEKYCWNVTAYNEAGLGNPGNRVDE